MKKIVLILACILGLFSGKVFAITESNTYNQLKSVPFDYMGQTYDKGVVICNNGVLNSCYHFYWSSSNNSVMDFYFIPSPQFTNQFVVFQLGGGQNPPYLLIYSSTVESPDVITYYGQYYYSPFSNFSVQDGSNWIDVCNNIKTSDPAILMTNTQTAETCGYAPPAQLHIAIEPEGVLPGSVVSVPSGIISCGTDQEVCSAPMSLVASVPLQANPNTDNHWVFGYWSETGNPHTMALNTSVDKTITARFYRTFRNAVTDSEGFRKDDGATGGECLEYVEYETDLPDDVCTYSAVNCLGQASMKGYATGKIPRLGAIVIYNQGTGLLNNGHAGIVETINEGDGTMVIHESNWDGYGVVHNTRSTSINNMGIMGYIYPTP